MTAPANHNGGPPLEPFNKRKWALALFAAKDKPHGAVAMAFKIYIEMDANGEGAVISDDEFRKSCGVSDGSCRTFKRWLLNRGFVQIAMRGRRGSASMFKATIPATVAAIYEATTGNHSRYSEPEYRQPMPVLEPEIPATTAGNRELAANPAGNPPSRARDLVINYNNKYNYLPITTTTTVEQVAARGGGECLGGDFEALNGTAFDLVRFISKAANVDDDIAKNMLRANIKAYGSGAMLEAYSVTMAEMATGLVGAPYKFLLGCAKKSAEGKLKKQASKESHTERTMRIAAEIASRGGV